MNSCMTIALSLATVALTSCTSPARVAPDFGVAPAQVEHDLPEKTKPVRIPAGYQSSRTRTTAKSLPLRQVRIDDLDPLVQNYEIQLKLVRDHAQDADGDALLAVWMTGRPASDGSTDTTVAVARSIDGSQSFERVDVRFDTPTPMIPFDPTVEFDPGTGTAYVSIMQQQSAGGRSLWISRSSGDTFSSFEPGREIPSAAGLPVDKGWLAAGPAPQNGSVLYLTDRVGVRISADQGISWSAPVPLTQQSNLLQPLVLANGDLAVSYLGTSDQALFVRTRSLDDLPTPVSIHTFAGSISELSLRALPGTFRSPPTTMIAAHADGQHLYAVLNDITRRNGAEADIDVLLFESTDGGATWDGGRNLTSDLPAFSDQFQPWLALDSRGHLHLTYFDTQAHTGSDDASAAPVDVWYALSTDGGASWTRQRLTPQSIPSESTRWSPLGNAAEAQFIGDYITVVASTHAAYVAHPVFQDGTVGMAVSRLDTTGVADDVIRDPRGLSGLWFEPATSGQGFEFNWLVGDTLAVAFYGHRDNGENMFLVGLHPGIPRYGETMRIPLLLTRGGRFTAFDASTIRSEAWGELQLTLTECGMADARLEGLDGVQTLALQRLARAPDLPCD